MTTKFAPGKTVHKDFFPVEGRTLKLNSGLNYHFVDVGAGSPVIMVHGNPSWSFYFRNLVQALQPAHRCLAPDHIGCGHSDKPNDDRYEYTLQSRVRDLDEWISALELGDNLTFVAHDWGGMIASAWAVNNSARVKRMVLLNTAAFSLPMGKSLPFALALGRDSSIGALLIRGMNAFSRGAATIGCKKRPMSSELRAAYCSPYDTWQNRIATLRFVQDIPLQSGDRAWDIVQNTSAKLSEFQKMDVFIGWGMLDFVFDEHFLREWERRLPKAEVHKFADCGHYVLEDAGAELVGQIVSFLDRTEETTG